MKKGIRRVPFFDINQIECNNANLVAQFYPEFEIKAIRGLGYKAVKNIEE